MSSEQLLTLIPDPQDSRDYLYEWVQTDMVPTQIDLRPAAGIIENQLSIGSCTANALVGMGEMFLIAGGVFQDTEATDMLDLSRLFNYKTARSYLSKELQDNDRGSIMRYNLKAANKFGVCTERLHPYSVTAWNAEPSAAAYADAENRKVSAYYRIPQIGPNRTYYPTMKAICHAVASGYPVLIGMLVGAKIRTLTPQQEYPYTHPINNPTIGGHELLIVGYNDTHFIMRNSWGKDWCDHGYFYCLKEVAVQDALDIWVAKNFAGFERCGPNLVVDIVTTMYRQALHREPDIAGLTYWKTVAPRTAMKGICSSDEFLVVNRSVSDLYYAILGRAPDTSGLAHWINTGLPLSVIATEFMASAEFEAKYAA